MEHARGCEVSFLVVREARLGYILPVSNKHERCKGSFLDDKFTSISRQVMQYVGIRKYP